MVLKADCDDVREVLKDIYEQVYLCINPNFHYADVSLVYQLLTESYGIIISNSGGNLQNNAVPARNHIHRTTSSQYHTMTCSPWQRRRYSHCR